ncbi:MAG: GcrA family cell cycle regulator [Pseudomonadota bacterium]
MSWTEERVETLKKMWAEGQSASQIAKALGGVTRNAVIGKVHRLGLSNRSGGASASETAANPKAKPQAKSQAKAQAKPLAKNPDKIEMTTNAARKAAPDLGSRTKADSPTTARPGKAIVPAWQPLPPQSAAHEIDPEAMAKFQEIEKKALKLSLLELTEKTCKWPIGDPATEDFWFCGLPVEPGKPYCAPCGGVAYQPMSARRDRRR